MRSSTAMGLLVAALIPMTADQTWTASATTTYTAPVLVSEESRTAIEKTLFTLSRNKEINDGMRASERYRTVDFIRARNAEIETAMAMHEKTRDERFVEARNSEIMTSTKTAVAARPALLAELQNKTADEAFARVEQRRLAAFTFERNAEINAGVQLAALARPELQVIARNTEIERGVKLAESGRLQLFAEARNREIEDGTLKSFAALQNREATRFANLSNEMRAYLANLAGASPIQTGSVQATDYVCRTKK